MIDYAKLAAFFDEYTEHYREFLKFELQKADMIHKNEIEKLSKALSTEQALIMKTTSYEGRRLKLTGGEEQELTFEQLIEGAPEHLKERLKQQRNEMSELIHKIKEINDHASVVVSNRLKYIQARTAELDTYDGKGALQRKSASRAAMSRNA